MEHRNCMHQRKEGTPDAFATIPFTCNPITVLKKPLTNGILFNTDDSKTTSNRSFGKSTIASNQNIFLSKDCYKFQMFENLILEFKSKYLTIPHFISVDK